MGLEEKLPDGVLLASVEKLVNWTRKSSLWPVQFGLACCAIEMMTFGGPRFDSARFGMEVFRASPRQADLMIVAGRLSQKMAPVLRQIYDQMPEPKWVLAMGVCASSGGMFNNYAIVQGVDHVVPVDMYLPGCPPRPEMLIDAILKLHHKIMNEPLGPKRAQAPRGPERRARPVVVQVRPVTHGRTSGAPGPRRLGARAGRGRHRPGDRRHRRRRSSRQRRRLALRRRAARHVRRGRQRRHLRLRRPGPRAVDPAGGRAALRQLLRRDRRRAATPPTPTPSARSTRSSSTAAS